MVSTCFTLFILWVCEVIVLAESQVAPSPPLHSTLGFVESSTDNVSAKVFW